ncbi:sugar phosphate isomerase/epimerase [Chlorobium sp. BLA1]|uniref:cobamide remodeling phosphodiesterase CbiR n=1 Tax=Candidatus Chlorobium masyuteum TaxID=2716876 RepID=UPI00141E6984|nr:cobamide remodeling phosphodiesterase CbiR [Candidatus Chlorobium masyuteum]NHQ60379.1 sugar phosphate isomerase/epimerase [Candidatus Chlorobium masyuteum]
MSCKQRFPFRFGTSSYIIPADIIPNVEYLRERVDDIELVLFESDEFSNLPSPEDMQRLAELAGESALTYSVHLPLDSYLGSPDRAVRKQSVGKCLRIIELTRTLPKSAFVLHFESGPGEDINGFSASQKRDFTEGLRESLRMLLDGCGEPASTFCAENLNYPFELVWPVIEEFALSVTLDVGHLEFYGFPTGAYLERYLSRAKVLHMHGTLDGKDHNSLACMKPEALDLVMSHLYRYPDPGRVFTMEIFSESDFDSSCAVMERFLS